MTKIDCKTCQDFMPDLLLDPGSVSLEAAAHVAACENCRAELVALQATVAFMDGWTAPEPSPFFDTRLHARLREEQLAPPAGLWERFSSFVAYSTGRVTRPALAGGLALGMLVLGGGTAATLLMHHGSAPAVSSPLVNDLRIYDNNAQAVDQMDLLDEPGSPGDDSSHS